MQLDPLLQQFNAIADARGWRPLQTPRNLAAALAVEAGELLALFQWQRDGDPVTPAQTSAAAAEAADVLLYLVAFCDRAGIDLARAVHEKQAANARRFLDAAAPQ